MTAQDPELSAALGWPGGISDPVLDRTRLLQIVAALRLTSKQALEALDEADTFHRNLPDQRARRLAAMAALRATLAQQDEPVEPVAKVIATAPKRIWLDLGFEPADEDITFDQLFEVTWSQDNATGWGIEYVRADLVAPPQRTMVPLTEEEIDRATAQARDRDALLDHIYEYSTTVEGVLERIRNLCRAVEKASWEKNHGKA